jgi:hypothetical protein
MRQTTRRPTRPAPGAGAADTLTAALRRALDTEQDPRLRAWIERLLADLDAAGRRREGGPRA